jgi:4-hydroxymandelate synthase
MHITAIDHLEYYVEDAERAAEQLCGGFGFTRRGSGGLPDGRAAHHTLLLRQRDITLLVTSALHPAHRAHDYTERHGDGIAVIGLAVDDAAAAFAEAVERGAEPVSPPRVVEGSGTRVTFASVKGFGDIVHRFTSREGDPAVFAPGLIDQSAGSAAREGLLRTIDHVAVCVPAGSLDPTVRLYQEVFGFDLTFEEYILVGEQAMDSKVVQSPSRGVTFTIIEPDVSRAPGQIDAFIRDNGGAGVQHVAFLTDDITAGVRDCAARGIDFLTTPQTYYEALQRRLGDIGTPVGTLSDWGILADRDQAGVMLQIFTRSSHPRGTLFYELIERRGARAFGSNNIKALYEAVERQRAAQGATHA